MVNFVELLSAYHIMPQFPPGAVKQAAEMPGQIRSEDLKNRRDLTNMQIITIDGDDAKDFDDAVSVEMLENGNFYLGVHIADVTHYVTEGSPIDRAAFSRGTSVYLIDTVIPMLPFELSNELCSLKPDVIRLAVSVFMEITPRGKIKNYEICNSFIKSCARMTYNNVTKILEGDEKLLNKYSHLLSMLRQMKRLAAILNKKRIAEGSVEFETHESLIVLDNKGKPVSVGRYPITLSNNIIEEFMLVCNVTVAKHLHSKGLPCVYRVHERPDMMRLERLGEILPVLGVDFDFSPAMGSGDFQKILNTVKDTEKAEVVSYLLLRSMAKAKYSENNLGHFGLGFETYCHFTSPIRRYADLIVHRILKESLKGEISEKRKALLKELSISASVTASVTEINATDAELEWKSVKKAEFMADKIGEKYEGIIIHILSSGFFVELPDTVEGFVAARTLEDDIYIISDNGVSMCGMNTKRTFTIGDKVKVKVSAVDPERKFVDFEIIGMSKFIPAKKNSKRKNQKDKNGKKILREITALQREEKNNKAEQRQKADSERMIFENAVIGVLYEEIAAMHKFSRDEKRFVGVTLQDMAANVSNPVYKGALYGDGDFSIKNALISAAAYTKNTVKIIADSFGIEESEGVENFAVEFVCGAIRHLEKCLGFDGINYSKREKEYDSIMKKIKEKGDSR